MKSDNDIDDKPPRSTKPQGLVIRAACVEDADAITALHNLTGYRYGTLRTPYHAVAEIRHYLESPAGDVKRLVADLDGRVVGDIGLTPAANPRRRHAASIGMGVHDDFVGQGIGSALMKAALDVADNWLALHRVELTVFTDNASAIRLYERYGFVNEGHLREFAFRDGRYVDAYTMARVTSARQN
ncbi:GNAT family N-acetyltransferase [Neorhizobium sp. NCHU2750]|uniref:GNAT family N-acetyltransferase n=1 Tax=Neorhizobium sp. NCHU2750 TaxID=1825976 RepID=UPI000E72F07A|nr:GNAT family acetyltransferase [Neorhizobium sp. NCHU2750]